MQEYGLVSPEGFEPLFFVPPRAQTNKTGTYAQQVVTRVAGYSWCLCSACALARICGTGAFFSLCFGAAWKIACQASHRHGDWHQLPKSDPPLKKRHMDIVGCLWSLAFEELGQFANFCVGVVRVFNRGGDAALEMCLKNIGLNRG